MRQILPLLAISFMANSFAVESCPEGFQRIGKLGCLQKEQEGEKPCREAIADCFEKYEGRLPSFSEIMIGLSKGLHDNGRYEWTDSSSYVSYTDNGGLVWNYNTCGTVDSKRLVPSAEAHYDKRISYRCFIP